MVYKILQQCYAHGLAKPPPVRTSLYDLKPYNGQGEDKRFGFKEIARTAIALYGIEVNAKCVDVEC